MIKFCSADYVFSVMHQSFETPRTPPTIIGGHPGQTGGFHLVFSWFRFSGSQGMHLFSQWLSVLYNAEAEWGFGRDFTCGSQAPLQDWVQVAYSQKTWQFNNWRRRYDLNHLMPSFDLTLSTWK